MKKITICNNKGGVGKTTACLCLAGNFAVMGLKVHTVEMDQQGSLSSPFLPDIHSLSPVVTEILRDNQIPISADIRPTAYLAIDIIPANFCLADLKTEVVPGRN